jgi:hypothetical protein
MARVGPQRHRKKIVLLFANCVVFINSVVLVVNCDGLLLIMLFYVLFVCECVLYYCHRVSTQLQLTNISYDIIKLIK